VSKFDQHCLWLDTCIGGKNHVRFVLFVAHMILLRAVFVLLCYRALISYPVEGGYITAFYEHFKLHTYILLALTYHAIALLNDFYYIGYYQFKAVVSNMTMNEQVLESQYEYFHNGNPFDKGWAINIKNFFCSNMDWTTFYRLDNVISV